MSRATRAVADLVADTVHHAADQQAVEAQPDRPQQQCAAVQPPRQAERAAPAPVPRCRARDARRSARRRRRGGPAAGTPATVSAAVAPGAAAAPTSGRRRYGRTCSDQPSGDSHDSGSTVRPASPTARSVKAAASTANATPRAMRALGDSCAATAATAVNTRPEPASASPNASEPAARDVDGRAGRAMPISPVSERRAERQQQRGGQAGVAADGGRVEQLGAAGLLVGAGVPDDGEDHRDGDQHVEHPGLPDADRAEAVVVDVAVHRALRRAGHDGGREAAPGRPRSGRRPRCCRRRPWPAAPTAAAPTAAARFGPGAGRAAAVQRAGEVRVRVRAGGGLTRRSSVAVLMRHLSRSGARRRPRRSGAGTGPPAWAAG